MKKETLTEKLIKRIYGISGPLDEHKRREADRIGNQVFIILFYLMIFGNLIPLLLAYKYPQEVALIYPPLNFSDCPHRCWISHLSNAKNRDYNYWTRYAERERK